MSLSRHVNSEQLIANLSENMPRDSGRFRMQTKHQREHFTVEPVPKFHIQEQGIDAKEAFQFIHNDLELDGRPLLNMASFVNTNIDDQATRLAVENITKNLADNSEYPALMDFHQRCVTMISHLWNVPEDSTAVGTATTGSSEAIHLGGLAMKRLWEGKQRAKNKSTDKPNILMGSNAQVALEKFARYFDVECRTIPVSSKSRYVLDTDKIRENLDDNTIGIYVILGSTYTGHYENVEKVSEILDAFEKETGNDVPIHVDAASGGFVAPFLHPDYKWDFQLDRVKSINTSGHKFGLTTAGLGWILWKDRKYLPDNLVFTLKYLGGDEETYTLNFSRPGFQVIHQYYNLVTMGMEGYRKAHGNSLANARLLSMFLDATGYFEVVSDIHHPNGTWGYQGIPDQKTELEVYKAHECYNVGLPVVSFKLTDAFMKQYPEIPQSAIAALLKTRGYIVPNYPLPPNEQKTEVLRVVVRNTMSVSLLDKFMEDVVLIVEQLMKAAELHRDQRHLSDRSDDTLAQHARKMLQVAVMGSDGFSEHEQDWKVSRPKC